MDVAIAVSVVSAIVTIAVTWGRQIAMADHVTKQVTRLETAQTALKSDNDRANSFTNEQLARLDERTKQIYQLIAALESSKAPVVTVDLMKESLVRVEKKLDTLTEAILATQKAILEAQKTR